MRIRWSISTSTHAVLDYMSAAALLLLPSILRARRDACEAAAAVGLSDLGYSALTDYEGGLYPLNPIREHLVMDVVSRLALISTPLPATRTMRR